jgi:hypothetical protein
MRPEALEIPQVLASKASHELAAAADALGLQFHARAVNGGDGYGLVAHDRVDTASVPVNPGFVPGAATVATVETKLPLEYVL